MEKKRYLTIDVWITLLIFLVILGHAYFSFSMPWYGKLHTWIYSFHMGAFFFVSGFLVCHVYRPLAGIGEYGKYIGKRLKKFGIPFVFLGVLLCGYAIWSKGGSAAEYAEALKMLFFDTLASPVIYLWFIYVLFLFYLVTPLFCQFYRYSIVFGFAVSIILLLFPLPRLFSLHQFSRYLIFFLLGIMVCKHLNLLVRVPVWVPWIAWIPFISIKCVWSNIPDVLYGILSLPCLFSLSRLIASSGRGKQFWEFVSKKCYFIYLLQMIFVNFLAWGWKKIPASDTSFCLFLLVAEVISFAGSLLVAKSFDIVTAKVVRR